MLLQVLLINDVAESGFSRQSLEYAVAIYRHVDFMDSSCRKLLQALNHTLQYLLVSTFLARRHPYILIFTLVSLIFRTSQRSQRGEGGVGFLVRECLVSEVEFITTVAYEESVWMKVRGERGRSALYIGCVYMPTDSTSVAVLDTCYERLTLKGI